MVTRSTSAAEVTPARHFVTASSIIVVMPLRTAASSISPEPVCEPAGCERCGGTGYRGRSGVFECLEMTESVRSLIGSNTDSGIIENAATQSGMVTMIEDAVAKCRAGITSAAEVLRVTTVR